MINVITRENQSGAAGMWVLQPHHNMHLRMFELARDHLEDTGMNNVVKV